MPSEALLVSINEFFDAYRIRDRVLLFDSLPLPGLMFAFIRPTLNLCTHQFTVDFVIIFCIPYIMHILVWISLPKTYFSVKNWTTFCTPYIMHILVWISLHKTFFSVKNWTTFCTPYIMHILVWIYYPKHFLVLKTEWFVACSWAQLSVSLPSLFFSSPCNF